MKNESRNAQYIEYRGFHALAEQRRSAIRLAFIIVIFDFESDILTNPFQQDRKTPFEITAPSARWAYMVRL